MIRKINSLTCSAFEHSCKVPNWPFAMKETLSNFFEAVVCSISWNSDSREDVLSWMNGTIWTPALRDELRTADWRILEDSTTTLGPEEPELKELLVRVRLLRGVELPSRADDGLSISSSSKPFWIGSVPPFTAIEHWLKACILRLYMAKTKLSAAKTFHFGECGKAVWSAEKPISSEIFLSRSRDFFQRWTKIISNSFESCYIVVPSELLH